MRSFKEKRSNSSHKSEKREESFNGNGFMREDKYLSASPSFGSRMCILKFCLCPNQFRSGLSELSNRVKRVNSRTSKKCIENYIKSHFTRAAQP